MFKIYKYLIQRKLKKFHLIGEDEYGNKYYINPKNNARICIYHGTPEPSKIPPEWHGWVHGNAENPVKSLDFEWIKKYIPNTTGTNFVHKSKNSIPSLIENGVRCKTVKYKPFEI